jgi:Rrf2 family protein
MKISTKGRYALRLMIDIAEHDDGSTLISLKDVAQRQKISVKYLEQIVGLLSKAGLLRSARGPQGGYRLSRRPEEYTVGSILRLTEGNLAPVACLGDGENRCQRRGQCGTLDFWTGLYAVINHYIDQYTLADLVACGQSKRGESPVSAPTSPGEPHP